MYRKELAESGPTPQLTRLGEQPCGLPLNESIASIGDCVNRSRKRVRVSIGSAVINSAEASHLTLAR